MATDPILEKVDILRKRFNITYKEAYDLLEHHGYNVVKACIAKEGHQDANKGISALMPDLLDQVEERVTVLGQDLMAKMQDIVRTGQASKVRVVKNGRTVLTVPAAVGAVGALLFPYTTVIATVAAMTQKYELVWDKRTPKPAQQQMQHYQLRSNKHTVPVSESPHIPGLTFVHEEEKEQLVERYPSFSSVKLGSL
ncbi:MAG: DUF4342 domain-containing protein [Tumebacillaceae bacterium]